MMERSVELVVGLLAILKRGSLCPTDPGYPLERLAFMIEDATLPLLLTQQRLLDALPTQLLRKLIGLDPGFLSGLESGQTGGGPCRVGGENKQNPPTMPRQTISLCYLHSGSTGTPQRREDPAPRYLQFPCAGCRVASPGGNRPSAAENPD